MSGLSRGCRTCCQKQQNKIQPANKKSKREFFRRENTRCTFSSRRHLSGGIFVSGLVGQHLPFTFSSRSVQPVNRQMLFCSFCFPDAKTRGAYFSASKTIASGLTGQHLPLSILFSYQSHNLQQDNSFLSGASRPIPSCPTSLQSPTPPPDHQHIPSGASRPTSPATILSIPAPQSSISQLPSSRLGRPTSYIPSNHFFNIHKASSSHQVLLPTILPKSTNNHLSKTSSRRISVIFPDITPHHSTHLPFSIFPFSISRPTSSRPSSFRTSNSNLIPPLSQRPPLLPSCCRFSNPQAKRET